MAGFKKKKSAGKGDMTAGAKPTTWVLSIALDFFSTSNAAKPNAIFLQLSHS